MSNQEIIGNAPAKQGKWPDCNQVDSDGKWSHRMPLIRSLADIKRIVELEKLLKLIKKDLLMRAEEDEDGIKVVDLSSSIWIKIKEALKEPKP
tara:strand:+ start:200 stop:478 length:279 start_codon:yes stop_codon:yes gene_type:complete